MKKAILVETQLNSGRGLYLRETHTPLTASCLYNQALPKSIIVWVSVRFYSYNERDENLDLISISNPNSQISNPIASVNRYINRSKTFAIANQMV
ncbi:MAG: hypothetical protein HWQ38_16395 [Nostoc sp. NMS7]|uniref:hypothetical protein n=1 Tax=Nostoc sp. NMS7 TaxID=2815391 RepID=UPI0025F6DFA4|nr:hypothetical protein [Nostoc sp. NMS7]MBN3947950.1 hypothetical protein [Nostoc sp. NMS7]